jgi:hypothetical protein
MGQVDTRIFRGSQHVSLSTAASGDTVLVTVPATKRLRLISAVINASGGANTITFKTGSTSRTGALDLPADINTVLDYNPAGWFTGALDEDLAINLTAATAIGGMITYILLDKEGGGYG